MSEEEKEQEEYSSSSNNQSDRGDIYDSDDSVEQRSLQSQSDRSSAVDERPINDHENPSGREDRNRRRENVSNSEECDDDEECDDEDELSDDDYRMSSPPDHSRTTFKTQPHEPLTNTKVIASRNKVNGMQKSSDKVEMDDLDRSAGATSPQRDRRNHSTSNKGPSTRSFASSLQNNGLLRCLGRSSPNQSKKSAHPKHHVRTISPDRSSYVTDNSSAKNLSYSEDEVSRSGSSRGSSAWTSNSSNISNRDDDYDISDDDRRKTRPELRRQDILNIPPDLPTQKGRVHAIDPVESVAPASAEPVAPSLKSQTVEKTSTLSQSDTITNVQNQNSSKASSIISPSSDGK